MRLPISAPCPVRVRWSVSSSSPVCHGSPVWKVKSEAARQLASCMWFGEVEVGIGVGVCFLLQSEQTSFPSVKCVCLGNTSFPQRMNKWPQEHACLNYYCQWLKLKEMSTYRWGAVDPPFLSCSMKPYWYRVHRRTQNNAVGTSGPNRILRIKSWG